MQDLIEAVEQYPAMLKDIERVLDEWNSSSRQVHAWSCPVAYRTARSSGGLETWSRWYFWVKPTMMSFNIDEDEHIAIEVDLRDWGK